MYVGTEMMAQQLKVPDVQFFTPNQVADGICNFPSGDDKLCRPFLTPTCTRMHVQGCTHASLLKIAFLYIDAFKKRKRKRP